MRDTLVDWLQKAHAMEEKIAEVLKKQIGNLDDWPELREKYAEHLSETQSHANQVTQCLQELGENPSSTKSIPAELMGMVEGMMQGMNDDAAIRGVVMNHATEHLEHATYTAIKTLASQLEYDSIADICESIIDEELAMADWLESELPDLVKLFAQHKS